MFPCENIAIIVAGCIQLCKEFWVKLTQQHKASSLAKGQFSPNISSSLHSFTTFAYGHELLCSSQGPCVLGQTSVWLYGGNSLRLLCCAAGLFACLQEHGCIQDVRWPITSYLFFPAEPQINSPQPNQETSTLFGSPYGVMAHHKVFLQHFHHVGLSLRMCVISYLLNSKSKCSKVAKSSGGHGNSQN